MNKPLLRLLVAVVGVVAVLVAFRIWQEDINLPPNLPAAPADSVASTDSTAAAALPDRMTLDPAARTLLGELAKILARQDVRPNETVLTFKDAAALARFLQRAGKEGLSVVGRLDALNALRVRYQDLHGLETDLAQNSGDFADVSGNTLFNIPQIPVKDNRAPVDQVPVGNDTLAMVGATGDRTQWGRGIKIAVLDTGVAPDPTFGAGRVTAFDIGLGVVPGSGKEDGHGTAVAALAAGAAPDAPGVAPAADVLSIRVTDATGSSDLFTIAQAIVTAVDAGAKVINVSLGGYSVSPALTGAISYATNSGAIVVAAAGNDQAAQLAWPAADPAVVSVGAVDRLDQQVSFSNSGPQLQLTAPGYGVQTAWLNGQRVYVDGTSASAPIVAGAMAALLSQNPSMTAAEAAALLDRTASDAGPPGYDPAYGNGVVNVGWAMNANNPSYVDTAVSSHYFDPAANQMDFVVQNRSDRTVAGLSLDVTAGTTMTTYAIPALEPGQTQVVKMPVDSAQLNSVGQIRYTTTLRNPAGIVDQVPLNNTRTSVLTAPAKKGP